VMITCVRADLADAAAAGMGWAQLWDIPPITLEKVHYLLPRRRCSCCGKTTTPQLGVLHLQRLHPGHQPRHQRGKLLIRGLRLIGRRHNPMIDDQAPKTESDTPSPITDSPLRSTLCDGPAQPDP